MEPVILKQQHLASPSGKDQVLNLPPNLEEVQGMGKNKLNS